MTTVQEKGRGNKTINVMATHAGGKEELTEYRSGHGCTPRSGAEI